MFFNSIDFAFFLPIVFGIYWILNKYKLQYQNLFIVFASYVFYGWWDYRFLVLIAFSTIVDYFVGITLSKEKSKKKRKYVLQISLFVNLGLLGVFKYYNFFVDNFVSAFSFFGSELKANTLDIILPVGISFYTFQTLSYSIDVYRRRLEPTKDFIAFASFVSFFPQLVAGPIERASNLLPQFYKKRNFDYYKAVDGCRQILWGLFKKMVIADNCAVFVNQIFDNYTSYSGSTLLVGTVLFAFQIYGDFSGYSDIAIGTSRLFGFNLKQNFAFPYFSRDIAEFWRRWHISLSTWFRDYLYIPLGGSRHPKKARIIINVFIVFLISGFWHGANWTFVTWGFLHALYFVPLLLLKKNRKHVSSVVAASKIFPSLKEFFKITVTFLIVVLAWVLFRAKNIDEAFGYYEGIFSTDIFTLPSVRPSYVFILLFIFIIIEWSGRNYKYALEKFWFKKANYLRRGLYFLIILVIFLYMKNEETPFIYFQF